MIFCQFIFTVTTAHHKYCHRWLGNKSPNSTFTQRVKRGKVKRKCVRERRGLLLPQSGQRAAWHSCHGVYVIRHSVWKGGEGGCPRGVGSLSFRIWEPLKSRGPSHRYCAGEDVAASSPSHPFASGLLWGQQPPKQGPGAAGSADYHGLCVKPAVRRFDLGTY